MHISSKPFVSTPADEEQAVSLQNGAVPRNLRRDKVPMEGNRDRAHLRGDQPGTVGRRLARDLFKRWRSEHGASRVLGVFREKAPGKPVETLRRMPLAPRRGVRAAIRATPAGRGVSRMWPSTSRSPPSDFLPRHAHAGVHELAARGPADAGTRPDAGG